MIGGTISHYEILEHLDRGGTGAVYKARDLRAGGIVALEILPAPRDSESGERLRREAEIASGLKHPHICPVLEIGRTSEGSLFLVRGLDGCETLRSRMERGPLTPDHALGLASQIAAALGRTHERGVVHRDLRPANIQVTADGQARVAGFGLSWIVGSNGACPEGLPYRSPEQLRGGSVDARTDIWSLGVLLHEMLTGRLPFRGAGTGELVQSILERDPEPLCEVLPGVPRKVEEAVLRALAKEPAARPPNMDELLVSLREILAGGGFSEADATVLQVPGSHPSRPAAGEPSQEATEVPEPTDLPGRRIAHFRILGLLGSGAMGTVHKAEDTHLRRTVALKFLPEELTRDPAAKARFLQEAQAASALDHPNLCTIHEVGETPDGQLYLAMAAYDGETVKAKIDRGGLPVAEAVEIARQVALGLAKAHRHGIVHRDIKPANLMVNGDGVVKILDFGVAKLRGAAGLNVPGSFLGTPAYMSPEQARGEEVDPRADVWSLGVVLYEMVAGCRPFQGGEDLKSVLLSLLEDRPVPLAKLRPGVTPELERIVDRMLARSPLDRYPTAAEALADLTALQGALAAKPPEPRLSGRRFWLAAGLSAAVLGLGGYLAWQGQAQFRLEQAQPLFTRLTDQEGSELFPSLAPDGLSFVYAKDVKGQMDLFLQRLDGSPPVALTAGSPGDDSQPAISPDGRWIAFRSERDGGGIYVISLGGGPPRRVSDFGYSPAWSPDGRELAVATEGIVDPSRRKTESEIWRIEVATGRRHLIVRDDGVQPSWSPDGRRIAYWGLPADGARRILWTVPSDGGAPSKVLDDGYLNWNPVWSPDGSFLYFGSDRSGSLNLWRLPINPRSGAAQGKPELVTTPSMKSGFWSFSRDGLRMAYAANESKANVERFRFDAEAARVVGAEAAVTRGSHEVRSCDVSPDGSQIAFHGAHPWEDLFVVGADGGGLRQLTNDPHKDRHPVWSPDGSRLLFYSNRGGNYEAWIFRFEGESLERVLPAGGEPLTVPVWSPDGGKVACTYGEGAAIIDLARPLAARRPARLPSASAIGESFYPNSWSADGEWLAGNMARLDGSLPEGIGAFSLRSRTYQRWTNRGVNPIWLRDGRRLLFNEAGKVFTFDTRTNEVREILAPPPNSAFTLLSTSPDDRSLFTVRAIDEGDVWLLAFEGSEKKG